MAPPPAAAASVADLPFFTPARPAPAPSRPRRDAAPRRGEIARPAAAVEPTADAARAARTPARASLATDRPFVGIGLILLSTTFFAATDVAAKMLAERLPVVEVAFIRFAVFVMMVLPLTFAMHGASALKSAKPGLQVLRGLGTVGSSLLFILGLRYLQVADATAANFVAPIFITALSVVFLKEIVGLRRWIATAVGLVGVLIVVRPGVDVFQSAGMIPVVAALVWAGAAIATRVIAGYDRPETTLAWSALIGFAVLAALVPFVWVTPSEFELGLGIMVGIGSTIGHWMVVIAFRHASASLLAPFTYTQLVWATAAGWLAFGVLPTIWTIVGGTVIAASGLYIAHRERIRARAAQVTSI